MRNILRTKMILNYYLIVLFNESIVKSLLAKIHKSHKNIEKYINQSTLSYSKLIFCYECYARSYYYVNIKNNINEKQSENSFWNHTPIILYAMKN